MTRCERCGKWAHCHRHHLRLRSQGGTGDETAMLCPTCHEAVHRHSVPDWRDWILRAGEVKPVTDPEF